jgi:hypothetical protein
MDRLLAFVEWIGRCFVGRSEKGITGSGLQIRSMSSDLRVWTHDKK